MADSEQEKTESKLTNILKVLGLLLVVLALLARFSPKPVTESVEYGVPVVSEIPLERLRSMKYIALYNTTNTASELTCKFELSAISQPSLQGYRVKIEEGDYGIYLREKEALIKGRNPQEILTACHVFACLREGIDCPNFMHLDSYFRDPTSMSVILDEEVGSVGGRGYAEIIGALSFMQSRKADSNGNGIVEQREIDSNEFFIYPFIKRGGECVGNEFNNLIQNWSGTNESVDCSRIGPAIVLTRSNEPGIKIIGNQVVVEGEGEEIRAASIILRDVIAPDWIRKLYGYM